MEYYEKKEKQIEQQKKMWVMATHNRTHRLFFLCHFSLFRNKETTMRDKVSLIYLTASTCSNSFIASLVTVWRSSTQINIVPLKILSSSNVYVICLLYSQMSNLMNQARLKVLKARDDMISVSYCGSFYHYYLIEIDDRTFRRNDIKLFCVCTVRKCWMRPASGSVM